MLRVYLKFVNMALVGCVLLLGYVTAHQWLDRSPVAPKTTETAPSSEPPSAGTSFDSGLLASYPNRPFEYYEDVYEQDLFRRERRQPKSREESSSGPSEQATPNPEREFKLLGVVVTGEEKLALMSFLDKNPETKQVSRITKMVREGQKVRDFTITAVGNEHVEVTLDNETQKVYLNQRYMAEKTEEEAEQPEEPSPGPETTVEVKSEPEPPPAPAPKPAAAPKPSPRAAVRKKKASKPQPAQAPEPKASPAALPVEKKEASKYSPKRPVPTKKDAEEPGPGMGFKLKSLKQ